MGPRTAPSQTDHAVRKKELCDCGEQHCEQLQHWASPPSKTFESSSIDLEWYASLQRTRRSARQLSAQLRSGSGDQGPLILRVSMTPLGQSLVLRVAKNHMKTEAWRSRITCSGGLAPLQSLPNSVYDGL